MSDRKPYPRVSMYCPNGHRERHPRGWERPCKTCGEALSPDAVPEPVRVPRGTSYDRPVVRRTIVLRQIDVERLEALTDSEHNVSRVIQEGIEVLSRLQEEGKRRPPPVLTPGMRRAYAVAAERGRVSAGEVAQELGQSENHARGLLQRLVRVGALTEEHDGRRVWFIDT